MQGNLKQIQLPEVLQFISMGKSSGQLAIRTLSGVETILMIKNGKIINSTALERQRRLGDLLVHRGILKRSVLSQVLSLQRTVESDKRLGQILVERDIVPQNTIRDVLRLQLEEEIWNLFGLDEGEFKFDQVEDSKLGDSYIQIDIEPLLLEGTRRQDEWRKIIRLLPNDKMILSARLVKPTERDPKKLTPSEWKVFAQINGKFSIRAIVNRSAMGRFEVYQILSEFLRRGLVIVKKDELLSGEGNPLPTSGQPISVAARSGVGAFFSMLTGGRREDVKEKLQFATPIGALSFFTTRLVEQFMAQREYKPQPDDARILESIWTDLLCGFTRADLIVVEKNTVNADRLEQFLRLFEYGEATMDCYEDCLEGLTQMIDAVFHIFAQRLGDRVAGKVLREVVEETKARTTIEHPGEFKLEERIQTLLRNAA